MLKRILLCLALLGMLSSCAPMQNQKIDIMDPAKGSKDYQQYINYFEKVFKMFEENYYQVPSREVYNDFLNKFRTKIYGELKSEKKSNDYVRWRSAWFLVDALRSKDDRFSQFYPPVPAVKFKQEALGQRIDLGIEGKKTDAGFMVERIEPRSDAYNKGLREQDIILSIEGESLKDLTKEDIEKKLTPLADAKVNLTYWSPEAKKELIIMVISQEYFKQTVFLSATSVEGVFCLEIPKFNRTTGDDLFRFLQFIEPYKPRALVLDLRGNPGGPPLAAREIASFFLKGGEEFTYFQKRGIPKDSLDVPVIDEKYKFKGPIAILVNADSGSASELFTGSMQYRKRAIVIGTNTAGQVLLKSMFSMEDEAAIGLVTGAGFLPDGTQFSFSGVTPDQIINDAPKEGLINLAAAYLVLKEGQKQ